MTVFVTGANGFVGRHVGIELARRGMTGRGMVRRAGVDLPQGMTVALVPSLDDAGALDRACAGCEAVVHLAARVHVMRDDAADPLAEFRRVNVEGTRAVLEAAVRAKARRFVFLSSVKVNGEGRADPYTEQDAPHPEDPYAVSKAEAEALVRSFEGRIETVIVRSPLVYGAGVGGNFRRLLGLTRFAARLPLPLGGLTNRRSLVCAGNLAHAIVHLIATPGAKGRTFLVSDGEDLSTTDLIRRIAKVEGIRPLLVPVPGSALLVAGRLVGKGAEVSRLVGSLTVDIGALRGTGWSPPYTVDQGLSDTVSSWRPK